MFPRGIEILLKKASIDGEFRALLLTDPEAAAVALELPLEPMELALLRSMPDEQLAKIIEQTEIPVPERRVFLGRVAGAMFAFLAGSSMAAADENGKKFLYHHRYKQYVPSGYSGLRSYDEAWGTFTRETSIVLSTDENGEIPILDRLRALVATHYILDFDKVTPATEIRFKRGVWTFKELLELEFGVRIPPKTLRRLFTVQKLNDFLVASLVGYEAPPLPELSPEARRDREQSEKRRAVLAEKGWYEEPLESDPGNPWKNVGQTTPSPPNGHGGRSFESSPDGFLSQGLRVSPAMLYSSYRLEIPEEDYPEFRRAIDRVFGVKMPLETLKELKTVGMFSDYVQSAGGHRNGNDNGFW